MDVVTWHLILLCRELVPHRLVWVIRVNPLTFLIDVLITLHQLGVLAITLVVVVFKRQNIVLVKIHAVLYLGECER